MSPDLNSLPPSRSSSISSRPHRTLPPTSPGSIPAPANPSTTSPRPPRGSSMSRLSVSERRRSTAGMALNLNELSGAGSGNTGDNAWSDHRSSMGHAFRTASPTSHGGSPIFATADPHHQRAPSLGELHQELEQEQEAQVVGPLSSFAYPGTHALTKLSCTVEPPFADDSQPADPVTATATAESIAKPAVLWDCRQRRCHSVLGTINLFLPCHAPACDIQQSAVYLLYVQSKIFAAIKSNGIPKPTATRRYTGLRGHGDIHRATGKFISAGQS